MDSSPGTTKYRILDAAKALLSLHGYESTTIDDIITAAGVTKGAFYHYFKSKELLCEAVIEQAYGEYQRLVESLPAEIAPIERLRMMLQNLARLNASGQWINCRLMLRLLSESHGESSEIQHKLTTFWEWYKNFYQDLITKCRTAGQLSSRSDPQRQSQFLLAMMAGFCTLGQFDTSSPSLADMVDEIINAL
jgi:TetR/AcrR family transcriptional regulator, transcriptional repressor for nem operon